MAEVDLHLENLTVPELIAAGGRLADGLTNNEHFPDPKPAAADLEELVQKLTAMQDEIRVRAVTEDKTGEWSDPVAKVAP
jgi:hypothetical protein